MHFASARDSSNIDLFVPQAHRVEIAQPTNEGELE